jgi:TM2 domain-containing membrane protein YozV/DNA-directed RNA polymerase subunit RPC12/RpoP
MTKIVKYEYKCLFCGKYLSVDETLSFKEMPCPECFKTITPVPPGLSRGPLIKVDLNIRKRRILAGLCGLMFGATGAHKFVLIHNFTGVIMLLASIVLSSVNPWLWLVVWSIGAVEGVIYLSVSDSEFERSRLAGKRYWF